MIEDTRTAGESATSTACATGTACDADAVCAADRKNTDTGQQEPGIYPGRGELTAKEYLMEVWKIDSRIRSKARSLETLRNLATSTSAVISDMPKAHNVTSRMANSVAKIVDLEREINVDMETSVLLKVEAEMQIALIEDPRCRLVLEDRYINKLSWERIAAKLGCSVRYALKIHGQALSEFKVPEDSVLYSG